MVAMPRSPLTSTALTVAPVRRGSLTSLRNSSLTSRWISAAIFFFRVLSCAIAQTDLTRDLGPLVALDLVADLDVVVVAHADTALGARAYLVHVVLEAAQRFELAFDRSRHCRAARESGVLRRT